MQMKGALAQCFMLMARIWELLELLLPNCSDHIIDQLVALHYSTNILEFWSLKYDPYSLLLILGFMLFTDNNYLSRIGSLLLFIFYIVFFSHNRSY